MQHNATLQYTAPQHSANVAYDTHTARSRYVGVNPPVADVVRDPHQRSCECIQNESRTLPIRMRQELDVLPHQRCDDSDCFLAHRMSHKLYVWMRMCRKLHTLPQQRCASSPGRRAVGSTSNLKMLWWFLYRMSHELHISLQQKCASFPGWCGVWSTSKIRWSFPK